MADATALGILFVLAACTRAAPSSVGTPPEPPAYLFSYFTRNGEDGVHLAYSRDGTTWSAPNGGKSVVTPAITGAGRGWQEWNTTAALMRDPSILRGPDGVFHLVDGRVDGSRDRSGALARPHSLVGADARSPDGARANALNTWAPDLFYDDATQQFVVVWSSSIRVVFQRRIRLRSARRAVAPTTGCTTQRPRISRPTRARRWEPFRDSLKTPRGIRHGSAFLVPQSILDGLLALGAGPP